MIIINDCPNIATEIMDLRDYIINRLLCKANEFLWGNFMLFSYDRRPHWKKRLKKNLNKIGFIISIAKTGSVEYFLQKAVEHFDENSRHRAFNIMLDDVYIGCLKCRLKGDVFENKNHYRFHYYLAIRIQKRRLKIKKKKYKVLCYVATVDKMSKMGSYIHMHIGSTDDKN